MRHELLASLEVMLAPETLTRVSGEPVESVRCAPFTGGHSASGSSFLTVETNNGRGPRFVVKRSSPQSDWIVRATGDELGREVLIWTSGLLDRLPPEIIHPVIACARDEGGWAILMRDVSDALIPNPQVDLPISRVDHRRYLDALAALHVAFWDQAAMVDPALGYCSPAHLYTALSPETAWREIDHPNEVVRWLREGWDLFWTMVEPDVADLLRQLFENPEPLCAALARYPQTLVHGDPRVANLGIVRDPQPRVVLIDWHFVGPSTPGVDLSWYLWNFGIRLPVTREMTVGWYRDGLAHQLGSRFDETWWQPQMELSLLGQLMRGGWGSALDAVHASSVAVREWNRQDIAWWSEQARAGARWL
jgi:hypothetical protein